ncbi:hypothetical protein [Halegenticoccus tardaugens]|uniref:hypothetical protein n=1 Tax=Halegenticoccus tardaugens TaxID=2071624 RepID=UPI00100B44BF|nr:hypothetical protein [Halegenticoccus tardaugens]
MALIDTILIFVISLLIGAFAIHLGAKLVIDADVGFGRAVVTALIGAIVWGVLSFFVGWIPLLGPLLMLVAWVGVINWQYPGGWGTAAAIGLIAWIVAVVVLYVLAVVGFLSFDALGVPGA